MRLLQLNPDGNESAALDFHPMVTVVTGLTPSGRARVIEAVTALPKGTDPGCNGLLEAHGILLDLDAKTLRMLDLEAGLDVLIRPEDVPRAPGEQVASAGSYAAGTAGSNGDSAHGHGLPAGEGPSTSVPQIDTSVLSSIEPLSVEEFLAVVERGAHPELDAAIDRQAQSAEALTILREAAEKARDGYRDAQIRRQRAEAALERATSSDRGPNLRLVTDEFEPDEELDHGAGETHETVQDQRVRRTELGARVEELTATVARIDRGITELASLDPRPVQVLVDAIRNPAPVEYVVSERGQELADEFVRLQAEVNVLEEGLAARGMDTPTAMARLDAAREELSRAEKAMRPPEYTDQDRLELEAAHDEVLEAEKKGRGRGRKRLEEAQQRERDILDRMGFPTWSAYVMGSSLMGIDPAAEQRLEKARFELEAAEQHWSDVTAMIEADPVHRELLDRLEALYLEAFDMLGGDDETDDLENKLRNLQEAKREVSMDELVEALVYQLEIVGIKLPPGMSGVDRTVLVAEAFLEETKAIVDRLNELGDEKVAALTELDEIEDELATLLTFEQLDESDAELEAAAAQGAEALAQKERDLEEARVAAAQVEKDLAEIEREHDVAVEEEEEYADFVEAREALLDAAIQVESVSRGRLNKLAAELALATALAEAGISAEDYQRARDAEAAADEASGSDEIGDVASSFVTELESVGPTTDAAFDDAEDVDASPEAVEFFLLARLAALRTVSFAGSVPLIIDDALAGKPQAEVEQLLHKLERMSESVQIIYLSDDATVTGWADNVGFEHAAVVAASPAFG
jgi:hypothetical protein